LIVATSGGNGLQQQQQQLFFCAVDLSWFFIMSSAWFLKSHRRRVGCSFQQQSRQQTQKAFAKTLQILLRKNRPIYATASNNR
jgi:Na+/melibiose symporter-like transporter